MYVYIYIYIYIHVYNFIQLDFGCVGSSSLYRPFSSCRDRGYSPVVVCGLFIAVTSLCCWQKTSSRAHRLQWLWHVGSAVVVPEFQSTGSIVVIHQLSCSVVCGIFLVQGLNPCLLHWQTDSLPWRHQGCPRIFFKYKLQNYSFNNFFLRFFLTPIPLLTMQDVIPYVCSVCLCICIQIVINLYINVIINIISQFSIFMILTLNFSFCFF